MKVGPRSAGAEPGPICYRRGGSSPTVTDANVVLGRIGAESFLGGEMPLDVEGARDGIADRFGGAGPDAIEAAIGIVRLAIAHMVFAVRGVSVERGYDPRDFAMVAQGGNGPLHAIEIARELGVPRVIIPRLPAIFSAFGMLMPTSATTTCRRTTGINRRRLRRVASRLFEELLDLGRDRLVPRVWTRPRCRSSAPWISVTPARSSRCPIPVGADDFARRLGCASCEWFDAAHEHRYRYATPKEEVEMVNLRVVARGHREAREVPRSTSSPVTR